MSFGSVNLVKQDKSFKRSPYLSLMASGVGLLIIDFISIDAEAGNIVSITTHIDTAHKLQKIKIKV